MTLGLAGLLLFALTGVPLALAQDPLREVSRLLDSGRVAEAPVFAPDSWRKAQDAFQRAKALADKNPASEDLPGQIDVAEDRARTALAAGAAAKVELGSFLDARTLAREARAQYVVPAEYMRAEDALTRAASKLEKGDNPAGLEQARQAEALFDAAEMAAIHHTELHVCDSLLSLADDAGADRHAPSTLALARAHRARAFELIIADRHKRSEAVAEAGQAEYEARHAIQLALAVRELDKSHRSWEEVLLDFESETRRISRAIGLEQLRFDRGARAATDSVIAQAQVLTADLEAAGAELADVSSVLGRALAETGESSPSTHPVELANEAAHRLARLTEEKSDWARMAKARMEQLAEVSQLADETAYELEQRRQREEKFKTAQQALTVSEGVVLYNHQNDIVLRLTGLSFDPGKADIKPAHEKILAKVVGILKAFPENHIVVEGHTDTRGTKTGNLALSEKRAQAVRTHLMSDLSLPAEQIEAQGHGDEQPVASNSSADGRAKNRRIDVVILQ